MDELQAFLNAQFPQMAGEYFIQNVAPMQATLRLAVTTNCSIDFMCKPAAGSDLIAQARLLKLGRRLAVGDALVYSQGNKEPVARVSLTYSIPHRSS